ncbi:MAG: hypothetical protein ACKO34_04915 [Vampirovibrionales bacterium]
MSKNPNFRKSSASNSAACPELFKSFYSVAEAGLLIGKSEDTITR